ncbi:MAG: thymidine phosphorylase [Clostridia bacterium]|nr:thymidine phosphorylase [Clostridia bacterium]
MLITEIIEKKREGHAHSYDEIAAMIRGISDGTVADYQLTAWMMAVCIRGMTDEETAYLTSAMVDSGETMDLSDLPGVKVDKHSTGGVGDTTTLVVAPLVAACGGTVAKLSGRGLAHSGGTLDKLESVPGVCIEQSLERFKQIVRKTGLCVIGQSKNLNPADKKMYALRDVTATVQSIPLIASSIMSKKIASGADAIVLDVKTGSGAFMETLDEAKKLARAMVNIGQNVGRRTVALITDMNRPLGMAIGNGLEMKEAIEVLSGKVPYDDPLAVVCFKLAGQMLKLSGIVQSSEDALTMLKNAIESGEALRRLRDMLVELGGDALYVDEPERLVRVRQIIPVCSDNSGCVGEMDAKLIGTAALLLGAGREKAEDSIDPAVGILMKKRYGDRVEAGEELAVFYVNDETQLDRAVSLFKQGIAIKTESPQPLPLVYDIVE